MTKAEAIVIIQKIYQALLGRVADPQELQRWATQIASGQKKPADLTLAIKSSTEYKTKYPEQTPPPTQSKLEQVVGNKSVVPVWLIIVVGIGLLLYITWRSK